jgi:hypothetical protein
VLTTVGILPKFLEPTETLKKKIEILKSDPKEKLDGPTQWPIFIDWLSKTRWGNRQLIDHYESSLQADDVKAAKEEYQSAKSKKYQVTITPELYLRAKMALLALRYIGLEIHGGFDRFLSVMVNCLLEKTRFPTTILMVVDPDIARQYVDIGLNLVADIPHPLPATLEQTMENYTKILKVMRDDHTTGMTEEETDREIEEGQVGAGKLSELKWEFDREKFRLRTRRRFWDVMIEKGNKERVSVVRSRFTRW